MDRVVKAVKKNLAAVIGSQVAEVSAASRLFDDLGLSEKQVEALMEDLHEQFPDAAQPPSDAPPRTVGDIEECFKGRLKH